MMGEAAETDIEERPPVPVLLVLLASDAVEVRYTDGSRLQLSPCGAVMKHHSKPDPDSHPIHGFTSVEQRVQFVTSQYRQKVLQALDFRNRFAERPYLCPDLLPDGSIVSLYADVGEALWPKNAARANTEILPDGSLRIISEDEYASVVLSPHGHDLTVCYLSRISEERSKLHRGSSSKRTGSPQGPQTTPDTSSKMSPSTSQCATPRGNPGGFGIPGEVCSSTPEQPGGLHPFGRVSTPTMDRSGDGEEEEPVVTPYGKTASFQTHKQDCLGQSPGMHDLSSISKVSTDNLCGTIATDQDLTLPADSGWRHPGDRHVDSGCDSSGSSREGATGGHREEGQKEDASPSCYLRYTWVTRHLSVNDCPPAWSQLLALVTKVQQMTPGLEYDVPKQTKEQNSRKPDRKKCLSSVFPSPLPLSCPSQHRHRWGNLESASGGDNSVAELPEEKIKVIMADGVVYRLVHVATVQVVEVYPGDGSVIVSQGASGHLFSHLLLQNGQVRERSYSIKALPPSFPTDAHSIQRTLKRANRILARSIQCEKNRSKEEPPCWQYEPARIVEPLPTSLLEECVVPGYGRFSAYTNGRLRIVFEDRVTVDMMCDFSKRISSCAQHSEVEGSSSQGAVGTHGQKQPLVGAASGLGWDTCRILQTNGQYVQVDTARPGVFHSYVATAKEWAAWVNSLPEERMVFYNALHKASSPQLSAEAELKKILCFNYIVDNTLPHQGNRGAHARSPPGQPPPSLNPPGGPGLGTFLSAPTRNYSLGGHQHPPHFSQPSLGVSSSVTSTAPGAGLPTPRQDSFKSLEALQGFHKVRQALLQTSKMIQDIDEILEKKGT